jgi:hypothetical protein
MYLVGHEYLGSAWRVGGRGEPTANISCGCDSQAGHDYARAGWPPPILAYNQVANTLEHT